jgi:hypothetical protein
MEEILNLARKYPESGRWERASGLLLRHSVHFDDLKVLSSEN